MYCIISGQDHEVLEVEVQSSKDQPVGMQAIDCELVKEQTAMPSAYP